MLLVARPWDDLADEYFDDHVDRFKRLVKRKFGADDPSL
jgi:hypothetical protein